QQQQQQQQPQIVNKIYVDEPAGALMFLDGNYIGYIPGSFDKVSGIHTVTLQQPGYNTISYNIELDDTASDRTFRFPALVPQEGSSN
ncbi:MAG: PEGA domain-containing protein, partial [Lachnospiraceae bacterium]|nr:PEGA domain-containing protein [Lachnospiraceae bacterium]